MSEKKKNLKINELNEQWEKRIKRITTEKNINIEDKQYIWKRCKSCGKSKKLNEYSKQINGKYGHTSYCKFCKSEYESEQKKKTIVKKKTK